MKRFISLILVALLLLATPVLAEAVNVDSLSLNELVDLRRLVNSEINERLASSEGVFYPFDYVVGEHIPAGIYLVSVVEILDNYHGYVSIKKNEEKTWNNIFVSYSDNYVVISVDVGDIVRLEGCTVTIRPYVIPTI